MRNEVGLAIAEVGIKEAVDAAEETAHPCDEGGKLKFFEGLLLAVLIGDGELGIKSNSLKSTGPPRDSPA